MDFRRTAAATAGPAHPARLALVLTGGGARAAYQVGVLRALARHFPLAGFDIVTGASAGAINALFLASRQGGLSRAVGDLADLWQGLRLEDIFRVDPGSLLRHVVGWGLRLGSGGAALSPSVRGLLDTSPLRAVLNRVLPSDRDGVIVGVEENLARCQPMALAVPTLDYATGETITWVAGCEIETWRRPRRRSVRTRFTVDHVMASAALPLLFPAVRLGNGWHGDGGIRLSAPLSPALHLGATRILAISTSQSAAAEERVDTRGYPPPAQILGQLVNAVFLDVIDDDVLRLERSNAFLRDLPVEKRQGFRPVDLVLIRPSVDLGRLAAELEPRLPRGFRFLTRGLGTRDTAHSDLLSLLMFQPEFLRSLLLLGEADGEAHLDEIRVLLASASSTSPFESADHEPAINRPLASLPPDGRGATVAYA